MKRIILCAVLTSLLTTGCKKFISKPDNSIITTDLTFNTSRDLDNVLYGAYGALASGGTLTGNWKFFSEVLADHVVINLHEPNPADPYKEMYDRNLVNAQYAESWKLAYTAIQNVNSVLYAIDNNLINKDTDPEFNEANRNAQKGEAHFIRGVVYFELVRLYCHQYGHKSGEPNSGLVLRTLPTRNVMNKEDISSEKRSTVEEAYKLIISDLKTAESLLPGFDGTLGNSGNFRRGRAHAHAAAAYLSRVYFQMNDYPNALTEINKVIGNVPGSIETAFKLYANVLSSFNSTGLGTFVTENIFDMVSTTSYPVDVVIKRKYQRTATLEPHLRLSSKFVTEAGFAANDNRLSTYLYTRVGNNLYSKKFDRVQESVPIIRAPEMVLTRAEIYAMMGNTADAIKDLNLIRVRVIPAYNTASVTAANALAEIRKERVREMACEGDRLHNLRRMHADIPPGDRAGVAALPWNSNTLLLKIPDEEILVNPGVIQNP